MPGEPAAHVVGDRLVPQRLAEDPRRHVRRAGRGERDERERRASRRGRTPTIAAPYAAALSAIALPWRWTRATQPLASVNSVAADGLGGVQQAEQLRPAVAVGDRGEQRDRDPEQHRVDVDGVAADQLLARAGVAPALADPREARRRGLRRRRDRAHPREERRARRGTSRRRSRTSRRARPSRSARPRAPGRRSAPRCRGSRRAPTPPRSSSRGTSRGSIASSGGRCSPPAADIPAATTNSTHTCGSSSSALREQHEREQRAARRRRSARAGGGRARRRARRRAAR